MEPEFLRLECRIKRWNSNQPCVFLIDTTHKSMPTAVYRKKSFESMDNIKGKGPRPLKTHAYNYSRVMDVKGNPITDARATDGASAEAFAKSILKAAEPVSREEYLAELGRIIWPSPEKESRLGALPEDQAAQAAPLKTLGLDFIASRSGLAADSLEGAVRNRHHVTASSREGLIIRQLADLLPRMDQDDLEVLLNLARTLAEE